MFGNPIDIRAVHDEELPALDYVLPGLLAGTVGGLVSPGGATKSMLALELGSAVAGGPDLLQLGHPETGPVAYLTAEESSQPIQDRFTELGAHIDPEDREIITERFLMESLHGRGTDIFDNQWFDFLLRIASGRRLLILDSFHSFHCLDEGHSGEMISVVKRLESIAVQTGCAIVFLYDSGGEHPSWAKDVTWWASLEGMTDDEAGQFGVEADMQTRFVRFGVSHARHGEPKSDSWYRRNGGNVLMPADFTPVR